MGALAPSCDPQEVSAALAFYDGWVKKYVSNELGDKSDEAMAALKRELTNSASVDSVLALKRGSSTDSLKQAFVSAGAALEAEYEQQRSDALGIFPCSTLISSGRHLLETWQAESAAIKGLLQVYRMLEEDIRLNDECLDSSGKRSKVKDQSVLELRKARVEHKKALRDLNMLRTAMEEDEEQRLGILQLRKLPENTTLEDLQRNVRVSLAHITDATFTLTGEIQEQFPEVVLFIGRGLPPDLGALWRPPQSLDDGFDHRKLVQAAPHPVWRVSQQGGAEFAIKEYRVAQASDLRTCLKEAATIYRQRHTAIVEIKALFQGEDKNSFYLQMPWYHHGSLDQWVHGDQLPKWPKVRSVLLDALLGLAHLHDNGVIHSDVKPQNILVDSRERGCLADFDISIDTKVRTSAAHLNANTTMRGTQDAWTAGFAAPELISSLQATRHTDIFAYGKTVHAVERRCEPDDGTDMGRGQTAELISALTSRDPESRLPAKDAMQAPFFAVLKDVSIRVTQTCAFCELNGDDAVYGADEGIRCSDGHFHCGSCLSRLTKDLLKVENQSQLAQREAQVMCFKFPCECRAPGFHAGDLARHLPVEDLQALLKARINVMNQQKASELEDQFQQRVNEELKRLLALDERGRKVLVARKHIEEEILQMRCPRRDCRRAFYDFDGCFAISCRACKCKFCGWCLADCGDQDAHPHVARCSEKPPSADTLFGSSRDFKDSHNKRCKRKVTEFLASLEPETRAAVRGALATQFRELDVM